MLLRYVRTTPGPRFIKSTFVLITEIQKTILSVLLVFAVERGAISGLKTIYSKIILQPLDTIKLAIPAIVYTVQNNLSMIAISNLNAATLMVKDSQYLCDTFEK